MLRAALLILRFEQVSRIIMITCVYNKGEKMYLDESVRNKSSCFGHQRCCDPFKFKFRSGEIPTYGTEWRDPDFRKEMEHRYWAGQDSGQPVSKELMNFYKKVTQFFSRLWALIGLNKLKKLIKRAQSLISRG